MFQAVGLPSQNPRLPPSACARWGLVGPCPAQLISGYEPLSHSGFSSNPNVENTPVRQVPRQPFCTAPQPVLLALRQLSKLSVAGPWNRASCPGQLSLSISGGTECIGSWLSSGTAIFSEAYLHLTLSLFQKHFCLKAQPFAVPGKGTHLVTGMLFRTRKRNIPPSP